MDSLKFNILTEKNKRSMYFKYPFADAMTKCVDDFIRMENINRETMAWKALDEAGWDVIKLSVMGAKGKKLRKAPGKLIIITKRIKFCVSRRGVRTGGKKYCTESGDEDGSRK